MFEPSHNLNDILFTSPYKIFKLDPEDDILGARFLCLLVFIYFTSSVKISELYQVYNRNYGHFVGGRWPISYIFPYWNRKYKFRHNFR